MRIGDFVFARIDFWIVPGINFCDIQEHAFNWNNNILRFFNHMRQLE